MRHPISTTTGTLVLGTETLGVTNQLVNDIVKSVSDQLVRNGRPATVKSMRFIPSSRVDTGDGSFEIVANTIVEVPGTGSVPGAQALDSVVTLGPAGPRLTLQAVSIPALRNAT